MKTLQVLHVNEASHMCGAYSGCCDCPETGQVTAVDCQTMTIWTSPFYGGPGEFTKDDLGKVFQADTSEMGSWELED
jgi:hypothetical protein